MTPLQILKLARANLSIPAAWRQGTMLDPETGQRCAVGSLLLFSNFEATERACIYLCKAVGHLGPNATVMMKVAWYNDNHTYAEVMEMFDRAIELAAIDEHTALWEDEMRGFTVAEVIETLDETQAVLSAV